MKECSTCKGRGFCGLSRCPVTSRFYASLSVRPSSSYMGGAPSVFVGSRGYPRVLGGPLLTGGSDNPEDWIRGNFGIEDIVRMRAQTIRGTAETSFSYEPMQEIALSSRPVDVEVEFEKPVHFNLTFDGTLAPIGLYGSMKTIEVLDNARVERPVERVTSDTDLRATEAVNQLYREKVDVHRIQQLLTSGLLGIRRHIVPTRWAITAVDDMIAAGLKQRIGHNPIQDGIRIHAKTLYGNLIICLLVPGPWSYEMIEIWEKNSLWGGEKDSIIRDGERERKSGYSPIAGAYYSARLAVLDYLEQTGRMASAIVIRRVSDDYWAPLGTWVIREAARVALKTQPLCCPDIETATRTITTLLGSPDWIAASTHIRTIKTQKTLFDFISSE
ncbi:MAG: hypothetical protein APR53_06750 [Methanoculleus sp. SDB]|nr:MAG: hypothetical protein APR53_06750 [Methanoculleus sp. SDB]